MLTLESIVRVSEDVPEVEVVGITLVPLLSNEMVSGGKDVVVKLKILLLNDNLSFSLLISSER